MTTHHLWFSTGILAQDRIVAAHKARLECVEQAINALGRLRNEWGFSLDQYPQYFLDARTALWKAYYAELDRKPKLMPLSDAR